MRRSIPCCLKLIAGTFLTSLTSLFIYLIFVLEETKNPFQNAHCHLLPQKGHTENVVLHKRSLNTSDLKDWLDKEAYLEAISRKGIGELGRPAFLSADEDQLKQQSYRDYGYNAVLSEKISLNRSVPDIRHPKCHMKKYLANLPAVSIIMPFYDEHPSVILRSCFGILIRSPPELIKEIILVDDASTKRELGEDFENYIAKNVPKTKLLRLSRRSGLIVARQAGAKLASAGILIFFDAHIEPNYNWLPPLIEPIAKNRKTCVCPLIDVINHDTFQYVAQDEGARGGFDWHFQYQRFPLLQEDLKDVTQPFKSPIMTGGLLAIGADFFWEFEGYDEDLDIWGGEQYELSFKIWMCGGQMLDAPCSRVAHIFRGSGRTQPNPRADDFLHKNFKRVAEVWMDEYKDYIYMRDPDLYANIDPGDLTKQKSIRERLKCKSFKWFMEEIAFDIPKYYPFIDPPDYASGVIRNIGAPDFCLDSLHNHVFHEVGFYFCASDAINPQHNQFWALSSYNDLRLKKFELCLDVSKGGINVPAILYPCHRLGGNQYWEYDMEKKWLVHGRGKNCLDISLSAQKVYLNKCDPNNTQMQWEFGFQNESALVKMKRNLKFRKEKLPVKINNNR